MSGDVRRVDKEVIHVDNKPSFCDHIAKGVIYESLEDGRGIGETKEHYSWFEESLMSDESGFLLVPVLDSDIVIFPTDIKFSEDLCPLEFIDEVGNEWKVVCIMDCVFINIVVVLTGVEATVLLLTKKKGDACGELEGQILPALRFSSRKSSVTFCSLGEREYTLLILGFHQGLFHGHRGKRGGTWPVASFRNTEA